MTPEDAVTLVAGMVGFIIIAIGMALVRKNLIRIFGSRIGEGIFDLIFGIFLILIGASILIKATSGG